MILNFWTFIIHIYIYISPIPVRRNITAYTPLLHALTVNRRGRSGVKDLTIHVSG